MMTINNSENIKHWVQYVASYILTTYIIWLYIKVLDNNNQVHILGLWAKRSNYKVFLDIIHMFRFISCSPMFYAICDTRSLSKGSLKYTEQRTIAFVFSLNGTLGLTNYHVIKKRCVKILSENIHRIYTDDPISEHQEY